MRERKFIRKCPDGCGQAEYDLGEYRGFHLTQKPFYRGWAIFAEKINPDLLDQEILKGSTFMNTLFDDTERADHPSLEDIEKNVISQVDEFWSKKEEIIKAQSTMVQPDCPGCGRKMQLIRKETLPNIIELKLVDGKPNKQTVTLLWLTWRCDHERKVRGMLEVK